MHPVDRQAGGPQEGGPPENNLRAGSTHTAAPAASTDPSGLHPATALVLLLCCLVLVYGVPSPVIPLMVLAATTLAASTSRVLRVLPVSPRISFGRWARTVALLAGPMLVVILVVQGLFYPGAHATALWEWGPAAVTVEGLAVALQLWLRVAATVAVCALFVFGSDSARLFDGLLALRIPLSLAYICAAALSLIPLIGTQVRQALDARAARGWDVSRLRTRLRLTPGIVGGLVTESLVQLDQRHDTLTQRGFGRVTRPTPLQEHRDGTAQRLLRWSAPVCVAIVIVLSLRGALPLPSATELVDGLRG